MAYDGSLVFNTKIDEKGIDSGMKNVGGKMAGGFAKIGGIAKAGLSIVATSVTAMAGAAAATVGASVKAYAQYEQLVGGVDTLFKQNSKQVQAYADSAFRTAGMSANEYMSTVTSFSASLIQSLGGDTKKAAEIGNQAVIDMADNSAKMGTGIESIQTAYAGFAKGQYMLLDNLKLGYGGTKTEMERLLKDASKISGIKYDISSFADVTQAIHVMQTEMGIAGTTAKEASGTIQGSLDSMKSAWQNLLTEMSSKDANMSVLIQNVVDSAKTFATNLLPVIKQALEGIGTLISQLLPKILSEIPKMLGSFLPKLAKSGADMINALFDGITDNSKSILDGVISIAGTIFNTLAGMIPKLWQLSMDAIMQLTQGITENAPMIFDAVTKTVLGLITMLTAEMPKFLQSGIDMVLSLVNGISQSAPLLIQPALNLIMTIVNKLLENMPSIIDAGLKLILGLGIGIINAIPSIVEKLPVIIGKIIEFIVGAIPQIVSVGVQLLVALVKNIPAIVFGLLKAIPTITGAMLTGLGSCVSQFWDMGVNLIKGLWEGIKSVGKWLKDKIAGFFGGVVDSIKDFFGIHSPSTLMRDDIGWFAGLGVGDGFEKSMGTVKKQMNSSLNGVMKSMQKSVAIDTSIAGTQKVVYANDIEKDTNARTSQLDFKSAVANAFENTKVVLDKREVGRVLVVKGA